MATAWNKTAACAILIRLKPARQYIRILSFVRGRVTLLWLRRALLKSRGKHAYG